MRVPILTFAAVVAAACGDAAPGPAPTTTITPRFDATEPAGTATVALDLTATPPGAALECRLGAADYAPCASPFAVTPGEGTFVLSARARAGGVTEADPPSLTFAIDLTAPVVTITSPPEGGSVGPGAAVAFTVSEAAFRSECAFDGGAFSACGNGRLGSLPIPAALPDGAHTVTVRATDLAGHQGAPATVAFTLEPAALHVKIVPRVSTCAIEVIDFFATAADATFACELDGTVTAPCVPTFHLPPDIAAGRHTFTITATRGPQTAAATSQFEIDTSRPQVQILDVLPPRDPFERTDPDGEIHFTTTKPVAASCHVDGDDPVDCTSATLDGFFRFAGLSDAVKPHTATVAVVDACGNTASSLVRFAVDSTPPAPCLEEVRTEGGPDVRAGGACLTAPTSGGSGALTFRSEPGSYVCTITTTVPAGRVPPRAVPELDLLFGCSENTPIPFAGLQDFGAGPQPYALIVDGIDAHGNASRTSIPWLVDTTTRAAF